MAPGAGGATPGGGPPVSSDEEDEAAASLGGGGTPSTPGGPGANPTPSKSARKHKRQKAAKALAQAQANATPGQQNPDVRDYTKAESSTFNKVRIDHELYVGGTSGNKKQFMCKFTFAAMVLRQCGDQPCLRVGNCTDDHPKWNLVARTLNAGDLKAMAAKVFPTSIRDFEREAWFSTK